MALRRKHLENAHVESSIIAKTSSRIRSHQGWEQGIASTNRGPQVMTRVKNSRKERGRTQRPISGYRTRFRDLGIQSGKV